MPDELLQQLRDIQTPPPAGWWPPAPGWWLLAILVLAAAGGLLLWYYRRFRRNRFMGPAHSLLAELGATARNDPAWFGELNQLLKRVARVRYPQQGTDTLTGDDWARFLSATSDLEPEHCRWLALATVSPHASLTPAQALDLASHWLRQQRC